MKRIINSIRNFFKGQTYTLKEATIITQEELKDRKLYRIFKEKYCEFKHSRYETDTIAQPISNIYFKGEPSLKVEGFLIGELLFGYDKYQLLKDKGIYWEEVEDYYIFKLEDRIIATFKKEYIDKQGIYQ